ncbi:hypothetical protein V2J09_007481 [Rumex salicifolius]
MEMGRELEEEARMRFLRESAGVRFFSLSTAASRFAEMRGGRARRDTVIRGGDGRSA